MWLLPLEEVAREAGRRGPRRTNPSVGYADTSPEGKGLESK